MESKSDADFEFEFELDVIVLSLFPNIFESVRGPSMVVTHEERVFIVT